MTAIRLLGPFSHVVVVVVVVVFGFARAVRKTPRFKVRATSFGKGAFLSWRLGKSLCRAWLMKVTTSLMLQGVTGWIVQTGDGGRDEDKDESEDEDGHGDGDSDGDVSGDDIACAYAGDNGAAPRGNTI